MILSILKKWFCEHHPKRIERPACYRDYPFTNPAQQAENDCLRCPSEGSCIKQTKG